MVKRILLYLVIAFALTLLALWIWSGGFTAIARVANTFTSPFGGATSFSLPWQIEMSEVPDTTTGEGGAGEYGKDSTEAELARLEDEYAQLEADARENQSFGARSEYAGLVELHAGGERVSNVQEEYVEILTSSDVSQISLGGWSIMSAISSVRVALPAAADPLRVGTVNIARPVILGPRERVIVTTGRSPVGISFRENACTGYLAQMQDFEPTLSNACQSGQKRVPATDENVQIYGQACMDFIARIPHCQFPTSIPSSLSSSCKLLVTNAFTYNGCVNDMGAKPGFALHTWRLYLGRGAPLWSDGRDTIRLIDGDGRIVDSLTY